ncbi:MAG: 4-hydroxy-tetrahydrodipicolinate reductase [Bacteroidetes bacterium]|nr:4-hydroxy-tetrahydrodipicolinate reductase [Bacteroidota bacterium]
MKIALIGYGKMGKAIHEQAKQRGHSFPLIIDLNNRQDLTAENLKQADVAIEFTTPETAFDNVLFCLQQGVPVVCGSTGWLDQLETAKTAATAHHTGLIVASNFSVGVNLFFELNKKLAELMREHTEYQPSLLEVHHTQKLDSPSGTAISLAEQILERIPYKEKWVNHASEKKEELTIISERKDPAPGTHHVKYRSAIDDIEIIHTAHNRTGFALGAVLAAEFIVGKTGSYSMKEVLGI